MNKYLNKLIMYHEIHRLDREGHSISYIANYLVLNWRTVKKYLSMGEAEYEAFIESQSNRRKGLAPYEHFVKLKLEQFPGTSASQIHDWLKEHYESFPKVSQKTVFNFVMWVRQQHHIPKVRNKRDYFIVEELPFGKQAQVDFGEYNIRTSEGKRKKVYFFAMVLSRSRYKYVYFFDTPFTTQLSIMAHEKAFEYFGGIPEEIVYDQDKVFMSNENNGDLVLTDGFRAYVGRRSFDIYFCRKADPETKGKIENVVKYVKQNFLYNRPYYDLETLNAEAIAWLGRTANYLPHGKTKLSPIEQWGLERGHLAKYVPVGCPIENSTCYTVRKDNTVSYKGNLYSVPQGTWKTGKNKVFLEEKEGLVIISLLDGAELCRHKKPNKKGQTIINSDHKRDKTGNIDKMITSEATRFDCPEKAELYFGRLRKSKPRYIRDQLMMIRESFGSFSGKAVNQALEYCLKNEIYSASDFVSVVKKYNNEGEGEHVKNKQEIKPLSENKNNIADIQPRASDITDYESIMSN
jgi:hypothetical protein